eukprot:TRINITY_DN74101_c0_g1_i1.p1 TRINITY_DN74101_c0_g1~~TRINITY_DN74101_c0_g1_i1.p1  ORF type:complete len:340 (-),score=83.21 TRINITY_DN74101_c0_g1_i1:125-1000(-)
MPGQQGQKHPQQPQQAVQQESPSRKPDKSPPQMLFLARQLSTGPSPPSDGVVQSPTHSQTSLGSPSPSPGRKLLQLSEQLPEPSRVSSTICSPQSSPGHSPSVSPQASAQSSPVGSPRSLGTVPGQMASSVDAETGKLAISWTVDAAKLRGHLRQVVSPSFELPLDPVSPVSCRLVIYPKPIDNCKGGPSFKKSGGWGSVQLKCEASQGVASFHLSITDGRPEFPRVPRGPVINDFAHHGTCGLPRDQEQWDFLKAVNESTQTFVVRLDLSTQPGEQQNSSTCTADGGDAL